MQDLTSSLHVFTQAMRVLCDYIIVEGEMILQENVGSGGYSIHNCVHSWTIHVFNAHWDRVLARYAIDATVRCTLQEDDGKPWLTQRRLLQHFGNLYKDQGKLAEAEEMYERALKGYRGSPFTNKDRIRKIEQNLLALIRDQGTHLRLTPKYMYKPNSSSARTRKKTIGSVPDADTNIRSTVSMMVVRGVRGVNLASLSLGLTRH